MAIVEIQYGGGKGIPINPDRPLEEQDANFRYNPMLERTVLDVCAVAVKRTFGNRLVRTTYLEINPDGTGSLETTVNDDTVRMLSQPLDGFKKVTIGNFIPLHRSALYLTDNEPISREPRLYAVYFHIPGRSPRSRIHLGR